MRKELVEAKTLKSAKKKMPWACKIIKVDGGEYKGFESYSEFVTWTNQK